MDFGMPTLLELPSLRENAALCAQLGLRFVEINMNFPQYQPDVLDVKEILSLREAFQIYFTIHMEEAFSPCDFNAAVREAYLDTALKVAKLAKTIEAPVVTLHLNKGIFIKLPTEKVFLYERHENHYKACMEQFAKLCEREAASSIFCVENTGGFAPFETRAVERLFEYKCYGLTFDVGHSHAANGVDEPFYECHRGRLMHMHLHDAKGTSNHLALGDGEIDLNGRLALAKECGCRVVLETKTVDALSRSVEYLKKSGAM